MEPSESHPLSTSIQIQQPDQALLLILRKTSSRSKAHSTQVDYAASPQTTSSSSESVSDFLPIFNTDKKFYTPSFVLRMDKPRYETRDRIYFSLHRDRVQSNLNEETSNLLVPKPFEFLNFCMVCKREFQDYQKHIQSNEHYEKMIKSDFCKDIDFLCSQFGNKTQSREDRKEKVVPKTKRIRKTGKEVKWIQNVETKCEFDMIF